MNKPSILVVEDDVPVRCLITTTLKTHGYKYLTASNGETALSDNRLRRCPVLRSYQNLRSGHSGR